MLGIVMQAQRETPRGVDLFAFQLNNSTHISHALTDHNALSVYYHHFSSTFCVHLIVGQAADLKAALELLDTSLHLLQGSITVTQTIVSTIVAPAMPSAPSIPLPRSQVPVVYATHSGDLLAHMPASRVPVACGGPYAHCQRRWRDFFVALEPLKAQCLAAGRRLVSVMGEIRASDHQGVPSRRQLFAQHRALSRALMDPDLQNLRRKGHTHLMRLRQLQAAIGEAGSDSANEHVTQVEHKSSVEPPATVETTSSASASSSSMLTTGASNASTTAANNDDVCVRLNEVVTIFEEVDRAACRLEQLTEQRRERLRELTRQRSLEDEINEVSPNRIPRTAHHNPVQICIASTNHTCRRERERKRN